MKIVDWPIDVNEIVHNRQPETFEEWAKIAGVNSDEMSEESLKSLKSWFEEEDRQLYLTKNVKKI